MAEISISKPQTQANGLRPVNLQTDLAQLADLIESAFSSTMDSGGRSAIREMRTLSQLGPGLGLLSHLNDVTQGMSMGYVWVEDGQIVGNVSVYPANYPLEVGKAWIIANVAVYERYQGRGIASQLMAASLDMIQKKHSGRAILQVDHDNETAKRLYRKYGFIEERAWTMWRRGAFQPVPERVSPPEPLRITQRRLGDAPHEYRLAQLTRPAARGGVDWLKPTHPTTFRQTMWKRFNTWLNLRDVQRMVIRAPKQNDLLAWLQLESSMGIHNHQVTVMADPMCPEDALHALLGLTVRRFSRDPLLLNHPSDDAVMWRVLRHHHFSPRRTVIHMRYDF